MKALTRILLPGALAAMLLAGCGAPSTPIPGATPSPAASGVIAEAHVVPLRSEYLAFPMHGRVAEVAVKKGDTVHQGQTLLRLGDRQPAEASLTAAQLELTSAQQALETLRRTAALAHAQAWQDYINSQRVRAEAERAWERLDLDAIKTDIDNAQATVNDRKASLDDAQKEFDKYKDLDEANVNRKNAKSRLDQAQKDYNEALRKLDEQVNKRDSVRAALDAALAAQAEAKHTFDLGADGPDADKLALANARLSNAQAQVAAAQSALDNFDLQAPFDGTIMDLDADPGQTVGPEKWSVALADVSQWFAETSDLTELEVVKIKAGQDVSLTADALPGVTMKGLVVDINDAPKMQGGDVLYTVRIRLLEPDPRLRWGMTLEATFPEQG